MGNIPSGIDATNWHWPDDAELDQLKALGTRVLTGYISYDSSKDITAAQIKPGARASLPAVSPTTTNGATR
jgi:hypothetical protein